MKASIAGTTLARAGWRGVRALSGTALTLSRGIALCPKLKRFNWSEIVSITGFWNLREAN